MTAPSSPVAGNADIASGARVWCDVINAFGVVTQRMPDDHPEGAVYLVRFDDGSVGRCLRTVLFDGAALEGRTVHFFAGGRA